MLAQRMAGLTGRTAALVGDDQWLQRAVPDCQAMLAATPRSEIPSLYNT